MSLKQEIESWVLALSHYDNNEFEESLQAFDPIADTAKIQFNCGVINATLGEHFRAIECYQRAIAMDKYFAVAYFQQGVSNFLVGDFAEALANFNDTLLYLRGNTSIDYEQLGLKFQLFSCEVLFNRGLCYIYLGQMSTGMNDLQFASREKTKPDHDVIDEAIGESAEGYTVFSIPVGVVYRPSEAKVKNLKTKEYLGKARLVAASDRSNAFTGFQGSEIKRNNTINNGSRDDRPPESISYAATNMVQRNLSSRTRQQSEPPIARNMFPPTPPPESEKPSSLGSNGSGRSGSIQGQQWNVSEADQQHAGMMGGANPASADNRTNNNMPPTENPRIGTVRSASETRGTPPKQPSVPRNNSVSTRQPLFRETTGRRRNQPFAAITEVEYPEDVYDMYRNPTSKRGSSRKARRPQYVEEDDCSSDYENDSVDDEEFEMVRGAGAPRPNGRRGSRRVPDTRRIRAKVHASDDTRFIIIGPAIEFGDFEGKIREKFGFKSRLKIKMQDDGDMVTLADQDDLDLLISSTKGAARKGNNDVGKMEVWVSEY